LEYLWRLISAVLASEIFPVRVRMSLMSLLGCDVSAKTSLVWAGAFFGSKNFSIAEDALVNRYFFFDGSSRLTIGRNVHIGSFVRVITGSHDIDPNPLFRCGRHFAAPVAIGDGCWIGAGALILPGVSIAPGCVIGAGSVVSKSTEPDGLYLGIPARRIRDLPTNHEK
jgi:maltose O-acetyltransferase